MIPRNLALILLVALPLACFGCGNSNAIKVTGKLLQAGKPYVPPTGQRVVVTLHAVEAKDGSGKAIPAQEPFPSYYDPKEGTFEVPGPDGYGISPGKYRISIFQGLTREGENKAIKEYKGSPRKGAGIDRETDFLKDMFGREDLAHRARSHAGRGADCRSRQGDAPGPGGGQAGPGGKTEKGAGATERLIVDLPWTPLRRVDFIKPAVALMPVKPSSRPFSCGRIVDDR